MGGEKIRKIREGVAAASELLAGAPAPSRKDPAALLRMLDLLRDAMDLLRDASEHTKEAVLPVVADLYYLDGLRMYQIAELLGLTQQAVSKGYLMDPDAPSEYLALRRSGEGLLERQWVEMRPDGVGRPGQHAQRLIRTLREEGWMIVPAVWGIRPGDAVDTDELWGRLSED